MRLGSRYAQGHVQFERDASGTIREVVSRPTPPVRDHVVYRWKEGDRIDLVAQAAGIPRSKWWMILDANPGIRVPTDIRPGQLIRIPRDS